MKQKAYIPSRWACQPMELEEKEKPGSDISWKEVFCKMLETINTGERTEKQTRNAKTEKDTEIETEISASTKKRKINEKRQETQTKFNSV